MPVRKMYFPGAKGRYSAATRIQSVVRRRQARKSIKNLKLNPTVKMLVDRRIANQQENHQTFRHYRRTQWNNIPDNQLRCIQLFPPINQDTTRATRLGSELKLTSGVTKGVISIPADDNVYTPLNNGDRADIMLRLFVVSAKGGVNNNFWINQYVSQILPNFLKPADAGVPLTGTNVDMWSPVNHDLITVHYDKVFRLKRGVGYFPDATSTSGAAHMPAINVPFTIKHKCKNKKVTFRGASANIAENFDPRLIGVWSYTNGAAASAAGVPFVEAYSTWYYKS